MDETPTHTVGVQRPVIPGFHPDPSVCRVGDTYYLVNSSFEYAPGVPIFRSTDLRSWEQIGNVLDRPSQLDVSAAGPSGGVFAATVRHHDGQFWMITTNWADDGGQLIVHAQDPVGPWSEPVRIPGAVGIDPDLVWDESRCLMTYAGFGPNGGEGIVQCEINPLTGEVLTEKRWLWSGTGGKFPEGPHLYRVDDWWYLLIAEGGTERGHAVTIARSRSPQGPFESNPSNPILTHRGSDLPVQNTGHADLVQRPDGSWAIAYHGVRSRGSSPEWHVLGRETFLDDVTWDDGWPTLTGHLEPLPAAGDVYSEDLSSETLPASWVGAYRFPSEFVKREAAGWRMSATGPQPAFLGRRQDHLHVRVQAQLSVTGRAGLSIRIDPRHALELECSGGSVTAVWAIGDVRHSLGQSPWDERSLLEIRTEPFDGHEFSTARGPDVIIAGVAGNEEFTELGRIDGRYLSTEVAGGMTGRMVGVVVGSGSALITTFRYQGADTPAALHHAG